MYEKGDKVIYTGRSQWMAGVDNIYKNKIGTVVAVYRDGDEYFDAIWDDMIVGCDVEFDVPTVTGPTSTMTIEEFNLSLIPYPNAAQLAMVKRKDKMEAFKFAQVKYELNADQRRALGDHSNYEVAMYFAYVGGCLTSLNYWRFFEAVVSDVLEMEK